MKPKLPKLLYDPTGTNPNPETDAEYYVRLRNSSSERTKWKGFILSLGLSLIFVGITILATSEWLLK